MPQLKDIVAKKKYKKYRPWDLTGDNSPLPSFEIDEETTGFELLKNIPKNHQDTINYKKPTVAYSTITINNAKCNDHQNRNKYTNSDQNGYQNRDPNSNQNGYQNRDQCVKRDQMGDQIRDQNKSLNRDQNEDQNGYQIKSIHYPKIILKSLRGYQLTIFNYLIKHCLVNGKTETEPLLLDEMSKTTAIQKNAVKTAIARLLEKQLIVRLHGKKGRSGYQCFCIKEEIRSNWLEMGIRMDIKTGCEKDIEIDSSSSLNIYKTTTNKVQNINQPQLPTEWQQLDLEPLAIIGFSKVHLSQITSQNKLSPEMVQDSIYAFAFDLQENNKAKTIKGDMINFFMGILRTGRIYTFPSNYESPQDKSLRLYRESKRKIEQERVVAEKEAINLAFNEWFTKLTNVQKIELLPELLRHNTSSEKLGKSKILESSARTHFETEIWPDVKNGITKQKQ